MRDHEDTGEGKLILVVKLVVGTLYDQKSITNNIVNHAALIKMLSTNGGFCMSVYVRDRINFMIHCSYYFPQNFGKT